MPALFGFPIRSDAGTFSAGSWSSTLPLTNMQDAELGLLSESSDATTASTKFDIDLGTAESIRVLALCNHNLSLAATVRIYADDEPTFTSPPVDTGALSAYPTIYPSGATLWGVSVSGALSAAEYAAGARSDFVKVLSSAETYRYWRIEISDTGNADGKVRIGRAIVASAYEVTTGFAQGAEYGFDTQSQSLMTDGGAVIQVERARRRRFDMTIPLASEAEMMVQLWEIQRRVGTAEQFFFVYDSTDTIYLQRRSFLATMEDLIRFRIPVAFWADFPLSVVEVLP